jgi:hypothetical protein
VIAVVTEVGKLPGWLTMPEAGEILGVTKQMVHSLVFNASPSPFDKESEVRHVGDKPVYLLSEDAVRRVAAERKKVQADRLERRIVRQERRVPSQELTANDL